MKRAALTSYVHQCAADGAVPSIGAWLARTSSSGLSGAELAFRMGDLPLEQAVVREEMRLRRVAGTLGKPNLLVALMAADEMTGRME